MCETSGCSFMTNTVLKIPVSSQFVGIIKKLREHFTFRFSAHHTSNESIHIYIIIYRGHKQQNTFIVKHFTVTFIISTLTIRVPLSFSLSPCLCVCVCVFDANEYNHIGVAGLRAVVFLNEGKKFVDSVFFFLFRFLFECYVLPYKSHNLKTWRFSNYVWEREHISWAKINDRTFNK